MSSFVLLQACRNANKTAELGNALRIRSASMGPRPRGRGEGISAAPIIEHPKNLVADFEWSLGAGTNGADSPGNTREKREAKEVGRLSRLGMEPLKRSIV
jgi:hypothetical protein